MAYVEYVGDEKKVSTFELSVLEESGAEPLDMFVISQVPMDESFTAMMGLSKTDGIVSGLSCSPMMTAVAFSCMIATKGDYVLCLASSPLPSNPPAGPWPRP